MTKAQRDELRRLLEAATPGEWTSKDWMVGANIDDARQFEIVLYTANNKRTRNERNRANAELIAAAKNAIRPLLNQLDALERELEFWRESHRKQYEWWEWEPAPPTTKEPSP